MLDDKDRIYVSNMADNGIQEVDPATGRVTVHKYVVTYDVGRAINHRIKQIHQHRFPGDRRGAGPRELVADDHERPRLVVAHRHQAVVAEDEGHRRGSGHVGIGMAHQRRRHVARAVLHVEAARNLDLLHFLARRNRDAEDALDETRLRQRRRQEIEPRRRRGVAAVGDWR